MDYEVRFVNPQKQYQDHRDEFLGVVDDVFSRGDLIMRRDLEEFENKIAEFCGVKHAIGVNSGTDALSLSVEAAGLRSGDEVITVGHTFMATISSIIHSGGKPILIDVGQDFNMDVQKIESVITDKTKAIMPVHLNGRLCDMEKIMEIASRYNLLVIEDAAQSLGAKMRMSDGNYKMSGSFGLTGCFSMYPFKMLGGFGDAGMVTTNDDEMAKKVRLLRFNGENREDRKFYYHGYTALLDNVQAALLDVKFKYFPEWIKKRRNLAEIYNNGLDSIKEVCPPKFTDEKFFDVWQNYVIRAEKRDELAEYLKKEGVEILISWATPTYREPVMQPNDITLPETEKICQEVISLPMYPELTEEQAKYVIEVIHKFYGE